MNITGRQISIQEGAEEDVVAGDYIEVLIDTIGRFLIPEGEFQARLSKARAEDSAGSEIAVAGIGSFHVDAPPATQKVVRFGKDALDFVAEVCQITEANITTDEELVVVSSFASFLSLPWETRVDGQQTIVLRKVVGDLTRESESFDAKHVRNLLIVRSHAYRTEIGDIGDLRESINDELKRMIDELVEKSDSAFRIGNIQIVKHATKTTVLEEIDFADFTHVHMAMHGDENGSLCLEDGADATLADKLTQAEFIDMLNNDGVKDVSLFFLSFCLSAGGTKAQEHLSYELIRNGIAEFVVGYDGGVGTNFARDFSDYFYSNLANGASVKKAFIEALRRQKSKKTYLPVLYVRREVDPIESNI